MKSIELYTAVADNGGARRDAGDVVTVGKAADQIAADRARDLIDRQLAVAAGGIAGGQSAGQPAEDLAGDKGGK